MESTLAVEVVLITGEGNDRDAFAVDVLHHGVGNHTLLQDEACDLAVAGVDEHVVKATDVAVHVFEGRSTFDYDEVWCNSVAR